ncbi:asparagine synthase-related protein [Halomonas sp. ATCH28]|uniref:asparagine synthase (glutamine-hydrolyzing) n=1 Tax=Halomonas gemina TaxID=2945105 RepID=A0ABT0SXR1_9GAMM|nr:asparagine synthase-related protein [Halomonas gemina]MCL7939446.1 asparagine synthase-related protein [Halomonas gemina]
MSVFDLAHLPSASDGFDRCQFVLNDDKTHLRFFSDLAGERPIYLYYDGHNVHFSLHLPSILEYLQARKLLRLDDKSTSFLLQNYVIPVPYSCYQNLYIITAGQVIDLWFDGGRWSLHRSVEFPFVNSRSREDSSPDLGAVQEVLSTAVDHALKGATDKALFLSGGKDSIPLAMAAVDSGHKDLHCVTYRSPGAADESEIAESVARRLNLRHTVIDVDFGNIDIQRLITYFERTPFPSLDYAALSYAAAGVECLDSGVTVLDGLGSDGYIGYLPTPNVVKQKRRQLPGFLSALLRKVYPSDRFPSGAMRFEYELDGLLGTYWPKEQKAFDLSAFDTHRFWDDLVGGLTYRDPVDCRAFIRGQYVDHELFMRKARNAADAFEWNVKFPWAQESVVDYFFNLPEENRFDRDNYRNKVILRDYIKKRVGVDSDKIGKKGFVFDYTRFLELNQRFVLDEILACPLWTPAIESHVRKMVDQGFRYRKNAERLYCLFMISGWYNHSTYLN